MGLLYPDHPDDSRPGLFEKGDDRRAARPSERRRTSRRDDRPSRVYDEPVTTSTTTSELKSLNDLMVRPPAKRRDSDRPRKEREDFRDARREERRERRERRDRATRERTSSPEPKSSPRRRERRGSDATAARPRRREESPPPVNRERSYESDAPRVRGPRKAERPRHERTSTYESDRRRESTSPRKRRPSYAESRRYSSYNDRETKSKEAEPQRRRDSRARYHSRAEKDLIDAVPAPPPFNKAPTGDDSESDVAETATTSRAPPPPSSAVEAKHVRIAPLDTILSENNPPHDAESQLDSTMSPTPERYNTAAGYDQQKPKPDREESFVSSYLEGSNLENGPPPRAYRPASSERSYSDDSEASSHRHDRRRQPRDSVWDEVEYYKYGSAPEDTPPPRRGRNCTCCGNWSRKRKCIVITSIVASTLLLIILIAVAASLSHQYSYTPSFAQVNNTAAFALGGATRDDPNNVMDSTATPVDKYTYYQGPASNFPDSSRWISFKDMWNGNLKTLQQSCGWLDAGKDNSPKVIQEIFDAVQDRANASLVDHRLIFATILQESNGCPRVGSTTSSGGVRNPGLLQSHDGHKYNPDHSRLSIMNMVQDGVQGTDKGDGIVQNLNRYGSPYKAARGYNSGFVPKDGDLSTTAGATKCYVSDIANRLTGWVSAESGCHEN